MTRGLVVVDHVGGGEAQPGEVAMCVRLYSEKTLRKTPELS